MDFGLMLMLYYTSSNSTPKKEIQFYEQSESENVFMGEKTIILTSQTTGHFENHPVKTTMHNSLDRTCSF